MEKKCSILANVSPMQSLETETSLKHDTTIKSPYPGCNLYRFGTGLAICLFIAESWLLAYTGKHVIAAESKDRGSSEEDCNSFPKQSAVIWVKCNRTSPCPVIRQGSYVTLIKLMHGMKLLDHIRGNETHSPKRPFRIKCDHFTLFDYREGALRWVQNSNRHHVEPNGSVTITTSAVYGLYNRFTMAGLYHDDDNKAEILHQVYLETSAGNRSKILFERNIALFAQSPSFDTSAYFDFVYLREGDRVYPTISNITYLYGMPKANTWGVFQLS